MNAGAGAPDPLDVLDKPQAIKVLRRLYAEEPMNQREFTEASTHSPEQAKALREALERAGVIQVRALPGHGNAGIKEIRLTVAGREIAQHLVAVQDIARRRLRVQEPSGAP